MKKKTLIRSIGIVAILLVIASLVVIASPTPPPSAHQADDKAIQQALNQSVSKNSKDVPALMVNDVQIDSIRYSTDGKSAAVWLAMVDRATRKVLASEPAMAVAQKSLSGWALTLPGSAKWGDAAKALPAGLLTKDELDRYTPKTPKTPAGDGQVFTGYYLPWEGGRSVWLTGSVAHFTTYMSCSEMTCRYAFDFSDGTMFPLLASKSGTVLGWKDTCNNGNPDCLNYIALEDISTSPVTTQLYLHIAYNSIPAALKQVGAVVPQGTFIANVDDTGLSTGHHLHFMVVGDRWYVNDTYGGFWWGNSVDISFADVDINGGRPRLCSEVYYTPQYGTECHPKNEAIGQYFDNWFISGNKGTTPPTGSLTAPATGVTVTSPTFTLSGTGVDNTGIVKAQAAVNYDGTWKAIGAQVSTGSPFSLGVDLCAAGVPDGPVTVGVYVWDTEGNRSVTVQDPRPILKNVPCASAPPACSPTANQVALYTQVDFRGACQVFEIGNFNETQLGAVGANKAASLQVGSGVMATLFDGNFEGGVFKGRGEAFLASDASLSDNRIGMGKANSLQVKAKAAPSAPYLWPPYNKLETNGNPTALNSNDSVMLMWKGSNLDWIGDEGGTEYSAELTLPGGAKRNLDWQSANTWSVGSLAAGSYSWKVTARNNQGSATSAPASFTVASASPLTGTVRSLPYADNMDGTADGWIGAAMWKRLSSPKGSTANTAWVFSNGTDYTIDRYTGGVLISPPLAIPAGGAWLRFAYFNQTEDSGPFWDQRRVQVEVVGGQVEDLYQLKDDAQGEWKNSPVLSLAAYAGKTVRIRFFFHVIDRFYNNYPGWRVDDVSVNTTPPDLSCAESASDNTPATATALAAGGTASAKICPAGDVDVYAFNGTAGQRVWIETFAKRSGSSLDTYVYLIDSDGKSVLAEADDIVLGTSQDSQLAYVLQRNGTYYIKVRDYNHPGAGGTAYFYTLDLKVDSQPPVVAFTYPTTSWLTSSGAMTLTASATDAGGVAKVEFYWHSPNWTSGLWELLGTDTTPADGWKATFDPTGRTLPNSALAVKASDSAGQTAWAALFKLGVDNTPPTLSVSGLPSVTNSTAVRLAWTGSDAVSGVERYEIQVSAGGGAWSTWNAAVPGNLSSIYYLGQGNTAYQFRMKAVDAAGNVRPFPAMAEAATITAATCVLDIYDASGGDNSVGQASDLLAEMVQQHNLCQNDEDWVKITLEAGKIYHVRATALGGGAAVTVSVLSADGQTVLAERVPGGLGVTNTVRFTPSASGTYTVRLKAANAGLWGTDVLYGVSFFEGSTVFLPILQK